MSMCPVCHNHFTAQRNDKKYCSDQCRLLAFAIQKLTALGWRVER